MPSSDNEGVLESYVQMQIEVTAGPQLGQRTEASLLRHNLLLQQNALLWKQYHSAASAFWCSIPPRMEPIDSVDEVVESPKSLPSAICTANPEPITSDVSTFGESDVEDASSDSSDAQELQERRRGVPEELLNVLDSIECWADVVSDGEESPAGKRHTWAQRLFPRGE